MPLTPGQVIGRYEVTGLVGAGGMASVYRVRHLELGSMHALKLLTVHRERIRERLMQEGRAQAQLFHPNVVRVTDVLTWDGAPVLVMEFVEGPSLDRLLETRGRPTLATALDLATGIARGLHAAHASGLVHRDLKPANVLLAPEPGGGVIPKIADFGLVKVLIEDAGAGTLTRAGVAMGTPEFMAPEQMRDASSVDARADLFSLGCVMYVLLSGRMPFEGGNLLELHRRVLAGDYVALDALVPGLPPALIDLVEALLAADPDQRPASADEVLRALEDADVRLPTGPGTAPPPELLALARSAGPAWERAYGPDPQRALGPAPAPSRAPEWALAAPVVAAALGLLVPAVSPTVTQVSLEDAGVGVVPEVVVAPAPIGTSIFVDGEAGRIWLARGGDRHEVPGAVPPGTYEILATFRGSELVSAGRVEVGEAPIVLKCTSFLRRCSPKR